MNYANRKGIQCVILAGESEIAEGVVTLKNMESGEQSKVEVNQLTDYLIKEKG